MNDRMAELREIILAAAEATGTGPLTETLKWGQPAFLTPGGDGTTIRLGTPKGRDDVVAMYVHCQTDLVGRWQALFPDEAEYEGNRAVYVRLDGPLPAAVLQAMAAMALTYHRDKNRP